MTGGWLAGPGRIAGCVAICAALLVGCAQALHNEPVNLPLTGNIKQAEVEIGQGVAPQADDMVIALSFSGGGTRAAAFSYGVLTGFDDTHVRTAAGPASLLDHINFVTGVSGGSVLAAYYGLKKRQAMLDFKQRFLLRDAAESLHTHLDLASIAVGLQGGVNDATAFPHWLDANLFDGATFRSLLGGQPRVWINASDIYNRTPFVFGETTFGALCSDLANYPISLAVAASAAVPVIFAPVVVENYTGRCPIALPDWVERARNNDQAPLLLRSYADALERYHDGTVRYVKLLDGGLVDNYGLAGITIARLAATTPYDPLTPRAAVKLRRLLLLVADAGVAPSGAWAQTVSGPAGVDLITAAADTATASGAVGSYSAFQDTMEDWRKRMIAWRCRLSPAERLRYGAPPGWNCSDVRFFIGRVSFDELGPDRATALNAVETSFKLPPNQIDMLIAAGHDALTSSPVFRSFLASLPSGRPRRAPVASAGPSESTPAAQ
jgi:NTE family protein